MFQGRHKIYLHCGGHTTHMLFHTHAVYTLMLCMQLDMYASHPFSFSVYVYQFNVHAIQKLAEYTFIYTICAATLLRTYVKKIDCFIPIPIIKTGLFFLLVRKKQNTNCCIPVPVIIRVLAQPWGYIQRHGELHRGCPSYPALIPGLLLHYGHDYTGVAMLREVAFAGVHGAPLGVRKGRGCGGSTYGFWWESCWFPKPT